MIGNVDLLADLFLPNSFGSSRSELILALGADLESCGDLQKAISRALSGRRGHPYLKPLSMALELLREGSPPPAVFANKACQGLPPSVRAILGSNLRPREMGILLQAFRHMFEGSSSSEIYHQVRYMVAVAAVLGLVMTAMAMFVFPQFREISLSLRLEIPPLTRMIMESNGYTLGGILLLYPLGLLLYQHLEIPLISLLTRGRPSEREMIAIFRFIQKIPRERVIEVLETLAHPAVFPTSSGLLREIIGALESGGTAEGVIRKARIRPLESWILCMGFSTSGNDNLVSLGARFLEVRETETRRRRHVFLGHFGILVFGTAVALTAGALFSAMAIFLGSLF